MRFVESFGGEFGSAERCVFSTILSKKRNESISCTVRLALPCGRYVIFKVFLVNPILHELIKCLVVHSRRGRIIESNLHFPSR